MNVILFIYFLLTTSPNLIIPSGVFRKAKFTQLQHFKRQQPPWDVTTGKRLVAVFMIRDMILF